MAQSSGSYIWFQGATGTGYSPFIIYQNPNTYNFTIYASSNGSSWDLVYGATIGTAQANAWNHIAIVRDGANIKCYMNGVLGSTTAVSTTAFMTTTGNVVVGSALGNANTYLNGYVTNLRAVKGSVVYSSAFTPPTSPLTAVTNTKLLLNFQDSAIKDNSGLNNIDTVGNADIKTTVSGKYSTRALAFDGTGDRIETLNNQIPLGSGDFTIEAWVNFGTVNQDSIVSTRTATGTTSDGFLFTAYQSKLQYYINGSFLTGTTTLNTGEWYHVAAVKDNGTIKLFLNGSLENSRADTNNLTSTILRIGGDLNGSYDFTGYIDDLRITKGVARYTSNFTAPTEALRTQ